MFGVVRCIVRDETVLGKFSSYCFEIFEMEWGQERGVGQPLIDLSIWKKKKCVVPLTHGK